MFNNFNWLSNNTLVMVDYDNPRWGIVQALIRCGLANNPTPAFIHQVKRYQRTFTPDRREYISIKEMLSIEPDENFKIVQSQHPSPENK